MLKLPLAAGMLAIWIAGTTGIAINPSFAQQTQPAPARIQPSLVGSAVYSSDGERLGQVTHVGTASGQTAVRAELVGFLDMAPSAVVIPAKMFEQKPDRIEIAMTAAEVKETLFKQQQQER